MSTTIIELDEYINNRAEVLANTRFNTIQLEYKIKELEKALGDSITKKEILDLFTVFSTDKYISTENTNILYDLVISEEVVSEEVVSEEVVSEEVVSEETEEVVGEEVVSEETEEEVVDELDKSDLDG